MQIVREFASRVRSQPPCGFGAIRNVVESTSPAEVAGVRVERAAEVLSPSLVRLQLALRKEDFVLLNTVTVSRNYLDVVLDAVEAGSLSHAYWYILEQVAHLPVLAPFLLKPDARSGSDED